jgi:uncharacterized membrane protein
VKRTFGSLNAVLMLGMLGFALWAWPRLPEQIPTHFGLDGQPDAWSQRTFLSWFLLPFIGIGLALAMARMSKLFTIKPGWVNLPGGKKLSDLPEGARPPVLDAMEGFMHLVATEVLVIFALIQVGQYQAAIGQESQGIMILVLLVALLSSPVLLIVFFLRLQAAMEEGKRLAVRAGVADAHSAGGEAGGR